MDRPELDLFCRQHALPAPAIASALTLTGNRPSATDWRAFAAQRTQAAGLGALGAGLIFFVAANWQAWGLWGRFALLQSALLLCVGTALWRAPPHRVGQGALLLATLVVGGLLALFGQSYQTGADVHELFFTWALLALPFALAGQSGALWALWWVVLNVGLGLLCGWLGVNHLFWRLIDDGTIVRAEMLMLPCMANLLGAWLFATLRHTRWAAAAPQWLVRFLSSVGLVFGTIATLVALQDVYASYRHDNAAHHHAVLLGFGLFSAVLGLVTWRRQRDVFTMALLGASWITLSSTWLALVTHMNDLGTFFLLAAWVIGSSAATGMALMHWSRTWGAAAAQGGSA